MNELVDSILSWWEEHQDDAFELLGEEENFYDDEPEFVTMARAMRDEWIKQKAMET